MDSLKLKNIELVNLFLNNHYKNIERGREYYLDKLLFEIIKENLSFYANLKSFTLNSDRVEDVMEVLRKIFYAQVLSHEHLHLLHKVILRNFPIVTRKELLYSSQVGKYRTMPLYTTIKDLKGRQKREFATRPEKIFQEMDSILQNFNNTNHFMSDIVQLILDVFFVHPFFDGNGRVFWILMDTLLIKSGYYPLFFGKRERVTYMRKRVFAHFAMYHDKEAAYDLFLDVVNKIYFMYIQTFIKRMHKKQE